MSLFPVPLSPAPHHSHPHSFQAARKSRIPALQARSSLPKPVTGASEPSEDLLSLVVDQKTLTPAGVPPHVQKEGTQPREAKTKPNVHTSLGLQPGT